jgi:hypothetical protein
MLGDDEDDGKHNGIRLGSTQGGPTSLSLCDIRRLLECVTPMR